MDKGVWIASSPMPKRLNGLLCLLTVLPLGLDAKEVVSLPEKTIKPFLAENCLRCHGPEKQKGKLRLDEMPLELSNNSIAAHWQLSLIHI